MEDTCRTYVISFYVGESKNIRI